MKENENRGHAHNVRNKESRPHMDRAQARAAYVDSYNSAGYDIGCSDSNKGRGFNGDWNKFSGPSNYSQNQYNQMLQHIDNPQYYNQFRKLMSKQDTPETSTNMSRASDSANMGGSLKWEGVGDW
ncbi:uncharacterized protein LOC129877473 [Solanum dulcamara]|uniref:uncharacterized protein LOC129877473 n=1 Tax=Solanum dulcamara TaxID=45834 RepID=UPI0024862B09|nr:uncharacterized protein LOC129877473 [Solanum dulcamara]